MDAYAWLFTINPSRYDIESILGDDIGRVSFVCCRDDRRICTYSGKNSVVKASQLRRRLDVFGTAVVENRASPRGSVARLLTIVLRETCHDEPTVPSGPRVRPVDMPLCATQRYAVDLSRSKGGKAGPRT